MGRRVAVVSVCCALAGFAAVAASANVSVAPTRAGASVVIYGGSPAQRRLARLTALRVGGLTIRRVVFQQPSTVLRHEHVRGVELVVSSAGKVTLRSDWEQQLYVGAYLGLMARWPKATIASAAWAETGGTPASRLRVYDVFGSNPSTMAVHHEIVLLAAAAAHGGARVVELRTIATPARLIAMTLRVSNPAAFLKHATLPLLDLLDRPRVPLLGYYLGVENGSGRLVWATSRLPGTGAVFAIPSLDACSPVSHGDAFGYAPTPCPAR